MASRAYIDLDDLINGGASSSQYSTDVAATEVSLISNASLEELASVVGGNLAGDKDLSASLDGLALWII